MEIGSVVKVVGLEDDKYNPKELEGVIVSLNGRYNPIIVEWSNGIRNSYSEKNLVVIQEQFSIFAINTFRKFFIAMQKKDHLVNNKEWFFYVKKINNCLLLKIIYICKELKQCRDDIERKKSIKELSA